MRPAPSHPHHPRRIHGCRSPPAKSTPWWHRGRASVVQCNRPELTCSLSKYGTKNPMSFFSHEQLIHTEREWQRLARAASSYLTGTPFMHNRQSTSQQIKLYLNTEKNTHFYLFRISFIYLFYIFFSMSFPYYTFYAVTTIFFALSLFVLLID